MKKNNFSRRKFIHRSALAATGILLVPNFISCSEDDNLDKINVDDFEVKNFTYGLASFDPTSSQVIIWTRYSGENNQVSLSWEMAKDDSFQEVVRSGEVLTDASRDFTAAIEVRDLEPGQKLYYRFFNSEDQAISETGETITLPTNASQIKIGICSCSNYPAGYFNVYNKMAISDVDVIVHLGDYIYEYAQGEYGTIPGFTESAGRAHQPANELITLDDYRRRYQQYRSDVDLKLAHQKKPFICVWDDHEVANDAWENGAENHDAGEGDFASRKAVAIQAYSEYLPVSTADPALIYRSMNLGNLVALHMLDTRIVGRDKQLSYSDYLDSNGNLDAAGFQADLTSPDRTLLGTEQRDWLISQVNSSSAQWQVLGQQVLMGKMFIPAELLLTLGAITSEYGQTGSISDATTLMFQTQLNELSEIKFRLIQGDPALTEEEIARVNTRVPYNLDAWDGYPAEREILFSAFSNKNLICLAGDTHNAWFTDLIDVNGKMSGKEIATSSVTSPGFEGFLGTNLETIGGFEQAIQLLIDDLQYLNASQRGYVEITFSAENVQADWIYVNSVFTEESSTFIGYSANI